MAQKGASIESLKRIDNEGVMRTWDIFAEKKQRFTTIGLEIRGVNEAICRSWGGKAFAEYTDQFDNIFSQVEDIGDALTEIADAIKEVIYDGFYGADDSLNQQLLEAQHNQKKGGGKSDSGKEDYKKLKPKPVLYSTIKEAYKPNLAYPQLPARPILVSTIGQAYKPNLGYTTMNPKPVLQSCLPSATTINLAYRNLTAREVLKSVIGDAIQADVSYIALTMRDVLSSTIPDLYQPDMSFNPLALRDVLSSVIGEPYIPDLTYTLMGGATIQAGALFECLKFLLGYTQAPNNLQSVQNTLMAAKVNQIVIESMAQGRSDAETAKLIGEAVIGTMHGNLSDQNKAMLAQIVGAGVFKSMYGRMPGEAAAEGARVNWIDTDNEKATLGVIRGLVDVVTASPAGRVNQEVSGMHTCQNMASILNVQTGVRPASGIDAILGTREAVGAVAPEKVSAVIGNLATAGNLRAIEQCIGHCAAQKNGGGSILPISPTVQNVAGNIISISGGTPSFAESSMNSIISGNVNAATGASVSNIVNIWSNGATDFNFGALQYPVAASGLSVAV